MAAAASAPDFPLSPAVRLWAAFAAVIVTLAGLSAMRFSVERRVAAQPERFNVFPQGDKLFGVAVQDRVFRDASLMPVYGSSELTQPQGNRADEFFSRHPTGFGAFLLGNPGETSLMIATKLAAAGPAARGKKVVVFLSPGWFFAPELDHRGFGVNFSPLHAGIFAFESRLGPSLQQALARRLLDYPETVGQSPLLIRALRDLAADTATTRAELAALAPLGSLHDWTLRQSDAGKLACWIWSDRLHVVIRTAAEPAPPDAAPIQWPQRLDQAEGFYRKQPLATSYSTGPRTGFDDNLRGLFRDKAHPERSPDENFARACAASKEWNDLQLLLRVARESEIELLLICQPLNASFGQLQGLTTASSLLFYERLKAAIQPYPVQLDTFPDAESDPYFYRDCVHPSAKAWVIYNQRLDAFHHSTFEPGEP